MRQGTPLFVGERLREAREARGLTAIALADVIGITRAAISQYENGHQSPAPDVMRAISKTLNLPLHRFLRPIKARDRGVIFYRCMNSATKRARARAERRYEWLREITHFLESFVRFPEVSFPEFQMPEDAAKLGEYDIEDLASEARRHWGLGDGPITNVTWLLENKGAIVCKTELEAETLDAFSEWAPDDRRPFIVLASGKESAARSRFDAAHELGHMLLHRRISQASLNQNASFSLIEEQAHRFAGAFLMPAASFGTEVYSPSLDAFRSLKSRWGISIAAMIIRARQLNLVNEDQHKRLWMNMSRRKWRTREPLDDTTEPERPRFLKRCFELLLDKGRIEPEAIPVQLGIAASDVESLIGLPPGRLSQYSQPIEIIGDEPEIDTDAAQIIRFPSAS